MADTSETGYHDILCYFHHGKGWKMIGKSLKMMEND
jgi:hypothetical protein